MYEYEWDAESGGVILKPEPEKFSKEARPVYSKELDILGFDKHFSYPKDCAPIMWAEANRYYYRGEEIAATKGGALYTAPELIIKGGLKALKPVDIALMIKKNAEIMDSLAQTSIKRIYNTYRRYKAKADVFYVAFSGGKDSVVALDLVSRALPHDAFMVLFGDTGMEFPDTYDVIDAAEKWCADQGIRFLRAKSKFEPEESWKLFGPPATVERWCCSVHKTAPQILTLREVLEKTNFVGMAFVGVRADESIARSKYKYICLGEKHRGQYSCNVILDWSSVEIYLYIFANNLLLNKAYQKGNRRVGCILCPRAAERNEYISSVCYPEETEVFLNEIRSAYNENFNNYADLERFIKNGGWKARKNGRDLSIALNYKEIKNNNTTVIIIQNPKTDWKEWIKTIGVLLNECSPYIINFKNKILSFSVAENNGNLKVEIDNKTIKENPKFIKLLKQVFRKSATCVACQECQTECISGYISFKNNKVEISENCNNCAQCHTVDKGCLIYKSLEQPKGSYFMNGKVMSLNSYSHHAPKKEWLKQYFKYKNDFSEQHTLGSNMYSFFKHFLRDAKLIDKDGYTTTAELIEKNGLENESSWGIIFVNLAYTPQVGWYVKTLNFNEFYLKDYLASLMVEKGAKENWTSDIFSSLVRLSELPLSNIGFGAAEKEKNKAISLTRTPWADPDPRVILYSLYRFAEECGTYQFTLSTLLDDSIERDGISPTRIFGLSKETMEPLLKGLAVNYPDLISASFSLDLDTITLKSDKSADDVLALF